MAITLNDAKVGLANKVDQAVIDSFRKSSALLDAMIFDDCISPSGSGSTLTYGYLRKKTSAAGQTRDINGEYTSKNATKEQLTTTLKIMGGQFEIDRVLGKAAPSEIAFQMEDQINSTKNLFMYNVINGSADTMFDGLDTALTGSDTEITSATDLSTVSDAAALTMVEELNDAILRCKRKPDFIATNSKTIIKLKSVAAKMNYKTTSEDAFGRQVDGFDNIPFLDLGRYYNDDLGRDVDIVPIAGDGTTDIYLICLGLDTFHGVTIDGNKVITTHMPDFTTAGAVKKGDVEFVASVALKDTRGAAVIRGVKVQAPTIGTLAVTITGNGATAVVTVNPAKPVIGSKYYSAVSNATITAPNVGSTLNTSVYTALPANGVVNVTANYYCRIVEADADKKVVASGEATAT
ncbi:MAG: hypothetical protein PHI36_02335 [Bacteroidales bacterium]|nr:hypothetical protein [Bacteroidales bacterium]